MIVGTGAMRKIVLKRKSIRELVIPTNFNVAMAVVYRLVNFNTFQITH